MRYSLFPLVLVLCFSSAVLSAPIPSKKPEDPATARGLEYLLQVQQKDGSWRDSWRRYNMAITSFTVLSFLSAGHVPGEGKHGKAMERAIQWVIKNKQADGVLSRRNPTEMYPHGITTLMLAEAGMKTRKDARVIRPVVKKAVEIILKAQRTRGLAKGGWRYRVKPVGNSDLSVTGWQIQALCAAKSFGCKVPAKNLEEALAFVKRCQDRRTGGFRYMPQSGVTLPCTGVGILALELLEPKHLSDEAKRAATYLMKRSDWKRGSRSHFSYGLYQGSFATTRLGDDYTKTYQKNLRSLILTQQKKDGSWLGLGNDRHYGPAYSTSMAILALTAPQRNLSITKVKPKADR